MMREILSKHDLRQLKLLEFLVKNNQSWTSLKDISEHLKVPIRTIHSDIQEINVYIAPIYIKSSASGMKISIPPNYSERYLYKKILEESHEFKIIELVFMNENENVESLSNKMHISVSTIKRKIKDINQVLGKEGFSIRGKPLSLLGNEQKLTQFMSCYFRERYLFQEEYMTKHEKDLIDKLINSTLKELGKETYFPNLKRISTRIYLKCIRLKKHHDVLANQENQFENKILNDKEFCTDFFEIFGIYLTDQTIKQLFYVFSNKNYAFNTQGLYDLIHKDSYQKSLYREIKQVLQGLSIHLNIPLMQNIEEKLLLDIMNIINIKSVSGGNNFILYDHREYFLSELSVNYIHVKELIKKHLKENIPLIFNENEWNELSYILLTHWPELYHKFRFLERPIKTFLLIDTDIEHGHLIKNELETYSRYNIEVENIENYSAEQLRTFSSDSILITNIPGITDVNCSTLCFGEFFCSKDWQEFNRLIENILVYRKVYPC